ncbi:hypothetical protein RHMOL_Rhmol11G0130200 [Rhododendron molle]|uniref:Uncharacterized protein n=1 Tax=Rhododendron molle TaxID=49168 RepID=A0ACC0LRN8_RHOML|nr:hypothetical protein RHMOL_Rhmol11G0130200 [Rhododendron molle]
MGDNAAVKNHHHQVFDVSADVTPAGSKCFDDNGRHKRTGTAWTASAHMITAVIGPELLSLAWATAQLGWIAGPTALFLFSIVTYYTSTLLAACYRSNDHANGERNYTYMDAVSSNLGGMKVKVCRWIQYLNLFRVAIGYTIASSISMMAVKRSTCFHASGGKDPCKISSTPHMLAFGAAQILLSQMPDFNQIKWLSIVAAVMSFTYSSIGLGLGIAKVAESGKFKGSLTGISIATVTETQKVWRSFQALGDIAFAYSYPFILVEIQDTLKSPPSESNTMKKATLISVSVTTLFYMLCGCFGYAAFGDLTPGNLLTGFGFYNPFWLLDIANVAIVVHLVYAYQVYCQPIFAFVEKTAAEWFPNSEFTKKEYKTRTPIPGFSHFRLNLLRLVWRTLFVILTIVISMLMPFFNGVVRILGAFGFGLLTVYFPVEIYIVQKKIPKWSTRWMSLQILSVACLVISIAVVTGSFAGLVEDLKSYKPFKSSY